MNGNIIIGLCIAALLIGILIGNRVTTWHYKAEIEQNATLAGNKAANGQSKIITKTQIITKVIHDSSDSCLDKPLPAKLLQQLK